MQINLVRATSLPAFLILLGTAACDAGSGGDTTSTGGNTLVAGDPSPDSQVPEPPFACAGDQILEEGFNAAFMVQGIARELIINFPAVAGDTPVAVVFAWHGVGDTAENFHAFFTRSGADPASSPDWPFILVVPQGMRLSPLSQSPAAGMEWAIFQSPNADPQNPDAALFEAALGCLKRDFVIDGRRIYMAGFSGGAILGNLLHSAYPQHIPAVFSMSGAWFNDPVQRANVNTGGVVQVDFAWDDLSDDDSGIVLQTRGGTEDVYAPIGNFEIIDFDYCGEQATRFLGGHNRIVIDCVHSRGHNSHPQLSARAAINLFAAHAVGSPSPYGQTLPAGLPDSCRLR